MNVDIIFTHKSINHRYPHFFGSMRKQQEFLRPILHSFIIDQTQGTLFGIASMCGCLLPSPFIQTNWKDLLAKLICLSRFLQWFRDFRDNAELSKKNCKSKSHFGKQMYSVRTSKSVLDFHCWPNYPKPETINIWPTIQGLFTTYVYEL